jgi:hypothetical protein
MRIAVLKESAAGERRVALVPENVARLVKAGHQVRVEREAGVAAGFADETCAAAGAHVGAVGETLDGAEVVASVRRPTPEESDRLPQGALLVGLLQPAQSAPLLERLAARGVHAMACPEHCSEHCSEHLQGAPRRASLRALAAPGSASWARDPPTEDARLPQRGAVLAEEDSTMTDTKDLTGVVAQVQGLMNGYLKLRDEKVALEAELSTRREDIRRLEKLVATQNAEIDALKKK